MLLYMKKKIILVGECICYIVTVTVSFPVLAETVCASFVLYRGLTMKSKMARTRPFSPHRVFRVRIVVLIFEWNNSLTRLINAI